MARMLRSRRVLRFGHERVVQMRWGTSRTLLSGWSRRGEGLVLRSRRELVHRIEQSAQAHIDEEHAGSRRRFLIDRPIAHVEGSRGVDLELLARDEKHSRIGLRGADVARSDYRLEVVVDVGPSEQRSNLWLPHDRRVRCSTEAIRVREGVEIGSNAGAQGRYEIIRRSAGCRLDDERTADVEDDRFQAFAFSRPRRDAPPDVKASRTHSDHASGKIVSKLSRSASMPCLRWVPCVVPAATPDASCSCPVPPASAYTLAPV